MTQKDPNFKMIIMGLKVYKDPKKSKKTAEADKRYTDLSQGNILAVGRAFVEDK